MNHNIINIIKTNKNIKINICITNIIVIIIILDENVNVILTLL